MSLFSTPLEHKKCKKTIYKVILDIDFALFVILLLSIEGGVAERRLVVGCCASSVGEAAQ